MEKARPEKTDLRVVKTKEAIRAAFLTLLDATDYNDITVTAIANEARISRKTFYQHYASIGQLLQEVSQSIVAQHIGRIVELVGDEADISRLLEQFTVLALTTLRDNPQLNANLIHSISLPVFLNMIKDPLVKACTHVLSKHGVDKSPYYGYFVSYYLGGLCSVYETWKTSGDTDESLERAAHLISQSAISSLNTLLGVG